MSEVTGLNKSSVSGRTRAIARFELYEPATVMLLKPRGNICFSEGIKIQAISYKSVGDVSAVELA
jgi:hypothetical protein